MVSDPQLLADYALKGEQSAFTELVCRHQGMVYTAALRQVGVAEADAVAQSVFIALARKAREVSGQLGPEASLTGWLLRATRLASMHHLRTRRRREANETAAAQLMSANADEPDWDDITPVLDEAIDCLPAADREAVVLRYFRGLDYRTIGQTVGLSDDAAQKRVSRALDRLRGLLGERGVAVSATALASALTANAVQAAPVQLLAAVTASLPAASALVSTTSTTTIIAMTTLQKVAVAVLLTGAVAGGVYLTKPTAPAPQAATPKPKAELISAKLVSPPAEPPTATAPVAGLPSALDRAKRARLIAETERDEAKRAAAIYQDLANRNNQSKELAERFPTQRHALQGIGDITSRWLTLKARAKQETSDQVKAALQDERDQLNLETVQVAQWSRKLATAEKEQSGTGSSDPADQGACYLSGAVKLNEQQFLAVYGLLQNYRQSVWPELPSEEANASKERMAMTYMRRAEMDKQLAALLTPEQAEFYKKVGPVVHFIDPKDGRLFFGANLKAAMSP